MSKSIDANFSGPFKVGAFENYLSKFFVNMKDETTFTNFNMCICVSDREENGWKFTQKRKKLTLSPSEMLILTIFTPWHRAEANEAVIWAHTFTLLPNMIHFYDTFYLNHLLFANDAMTKWITEHFLFLVEWKIYTQLSIFWSFFCLDALLADLQNSVPGHQQNPLNQTYTGQNGSASSGYGSLRSRQSPQSVI